jgi:hypothetical protein
MHRSRCRVTRYFPFEQTRFHAADTGRLTGAKNIGYARLLPVIYRNKVAAKLTTPAKLATEE